jgi:hypothetical protein
MERLAREAKKLSVKREAALERVRARPSLRASIERRHGSVEAWAEARAAEDEAALAENAEAALASYERQRAEHLREVYEGERRSGAFLALDGGALDLSGHRGEPRRDLFARLGLARGGPLGTPSTNRLQTYEDEAELLTALAGALRGEGRAELAEVVDDALAGARRLADADRRLYHGDGLAPAGAGGLGSALTGAADGSD